MTPSQRYPLGVTTYRLPDRGVLPELSGTTLAGGPLSVSSLRGGVLVLNVWASWCEPCRDESAALGRAAQRWRPAGVRFVGLDENDTSAAATSFLRSVAVTYPHLVDEGALLGRLSTWLPVAVPSTLVVDPQGRVAARVVGVVTAEQIDALIRDADAPRASSAPAVTP